MDFGPLINWCLDQETMHSGYERCSGCSWGCYQIFQVLKLFHFTTIRR